MPSKFPYKIVDVCWEDSEHSADWSSLVTVLEEQENGTLECRSAGFLIADKEDRIILATSVLSDSDREQQVSAYITIPKRSILWVKELKYKTPAKKKIIVTQEQ